MPGQFHFKTGRHVAAARILAGLTQIELASLAGLHVNSLKRLEGMDGIAGSAHACCRISEALETRGVLSQTMPLPALHVIEIEAPKLSSGR